LRRITNLWPEGRVKAFTLSYDDGVEQDRKLVAIFNRYHLKATFNLNSGLQNESSFWIKNGITIKRMNADGLKALYEGHEVAAHSLTHPKLNEIPEDEIRTEISKDKRNLEVLFEYPVRGMAYPFGVYDDKVIEIIESCGIEYSRTVKQHERFTIPEDFYEWHPTCHHNHPRLMDLAGAFISNKVESLALFYVWGHSYEFELDRNWESIERFCEFIGDREDIWYATNIQIVDYLKAQSALIYSEDQAEVFNPGSIPVWLDVDGEILKVLPNNALRLVG